MQDTAPPVSLNTILAGLAALASFVGIPVSNLITVFLMRRQNAANVHKTDAETDLTGARSDLAKARSHQIESVILFKAYKRLDEFENMNHDQSREITRQARQISELEWQLSLADGREKVLNESVRQAHAELEMLRKPRLAP